MCFLWVFEEAKIMSIPANTNAGYVPTSLSAYTKKACAACFSGFFEVLCVFGLVGKAKVTYSVIRSVSVNMIDALFWPTTVIIKPRKFMGRVGIWEHPYSNISISLSSPCNISNAYASGSDCSGENASNWVVMKQPLQDTVVKGILSLAHGLSPSDYVKWVLEAATSDTRELYVKGA